MIFKYHSRSSKVAPIKSQCMISYKQSIVTFTVSHTILQKFDVKQSNDLEISPRSSTVASRESYHVAMHVKYSEDSERKTRKSPFSRTTLSFDAPSPANPHEYPHKLYTARNCVPCSTFLLLKVYAQLCICKFLNNFVRKPEYAKPLDAEPKIDFNAKQPFKVIYFNVTVKPRSDYHRLNGSSSPVLTATCLSYKSLCDFLTFFPEHAWWSDPQTDLHAKWLKRRGFTYRCVFCAKS